eukprot:TRINITY_DN37363_c0_g1_i1.p1 TRINITY_DN37363_c0_g1~~TRINITY_DN37363_c0_g1_i1.p1  ORF type:complete len:351 (+),score=32.63 TRINITY_DN37363_c0_g1_i1:60-1112(+)
MSCHIIFLAMLLVLSGASAQTGTCSSSSDKLRTFTFKWASPPASPVFVGDLGVDQAIRIFCLELVELPNTGSCSVPSVAVLCRNSFADTSNCVTLSEYTYTAVKEVTYGDSNGPDVRWLLLWNPRSLPAQCYTGGRDVTVRITYQLESPGGGSAVLAIVAIIIVTLLALVVCVFGLSRLLETSRDKREAKKRAKQGHGHGQGQEAASPSVFGVPEGQIALCPKCGQGQIMPWQREDALLDVRCRNCGKTSYGWTNVGGPSPDQQTPLGSEYSPEVVRPTARRSGYTAAEVALKYEDKEYASPYENPLDHTFPPRTIQTPSASPIPGHPARHTYGVTMDPDAVFEPPPRLN